MKTTVTALALVMALGFGLPTAASAAPEDKRALTVMTRNVYVGTGFDNVFAATTPAEFVAAVTVDWANVQATDFSVRASALADEIALASPDLVGLQEVALWRIQEPSDPSTPATTVAQDFLAMLLDELAERGQAYGVAVSATNADAEAPAFGPNGLFDLRITDHDVVLARQGVDIANPQSGTYAARFVAPSPVGGIPFPRTWTAVDVTVDGKGARFVNTHLEPASAAVQEAQAAELLAGPLATKLPVIAVGDFNSAADGSTTPTYEMLRRAHFDDAWSGPGGLTCCHAELLDNPAPALTSRIDLVLLHGPVRALSADVVGDEATDRVSGLWPSDHAGVVARVRVH